MAGTLYLVATPIGNLEDITVRASRILREVATIACEDTRRTRKLLDHLGITTSLLSYHEHNEASRTQELANRLLAGDSIALVSDAGTPLVSDPGFRLVREAIALGIEVVPVPGPSAALAALAASGLPVDSFLFVGFLPAKSSARRREIESLRGQSATLIMYEAPHRILETLDDVVELLGPDRPVVVARELTKVYEEFLRGTAGEVRARLASRGSVKGEITLLVGPEPLPAAGANLPEEVERRMAEGLSKMEAIKAVAHRYGIPKREIYKLAQGPDEKK